MIKKFKHWLWDHFLPMWAKETLLRDCRALQKENEELKKSLEVQKAYIAGINAGTRSLRRIVINNSGRVSGESADK